MSQLLTTCKAAEPATIPLLATRVLQALGTCALVVVETIVVISKLFPARRRDPVPARVRLQHDEAVIDPVRPATHAYRLGASEGHQQPRDAAVLEGNQDRGATGAACRLQRCTCKSTNLILRECSVDRNSEYRRKRLNGLNLSQHMRRQPRRACEHVTERRPRVICHELLQIRCSLPAGRIQA